jgi:hypothetical protein
MLIGKIKIEATGMLSETDIDRPFGSIKLRACFERSSADPIADPLGAAPVAR